MRRRRFMTVLGAVLLAGCSGDGDSNGTDPESAPSDPTETGDGYSPSVTWDSCTSVTVDSSEPYNAVALGLADGNTTMNEESFEGETTFESDIAINTVVIWSDAGQASVDNPDYESCQESS